MEEDACECGVDQQTARHILHEYRLFSRQRREWWAKDRRKTLYEVIPHEDKMNIPRYMIKAADFIRSTGLIGQYQTLDEGQEQGFGKADRQKTGCDVDEGASAL